MNKYHIGLKFNIPLFTDESIIEKFFHLGSANGSPNQLARVNPELISLLTSKEMIPVACDYFVREPYDEMFIHVDGPPDPIGGKGKLNWVYGQDDNSKMNWFEPIDKNKYKTYHYGIPLTIYDKDNVRVVESSVIAGTPSLVNVGEPHNITNGANRRLCICLYLNDKRTNAAPTWDRCIEVFREYSI
jgi:hypothetical protein